MAASCISPLHPAAGILHATTGITHRHLTNTSHTSHRHLTQQGPAPVASSAAARGIQRQPVAAAPAHWSSAALLSRRLPEAGPAPQSSQWCWAPRRSPAAAAAEDRTALSALALPFMLQARHCLSSGEHGDAHVCSYKLAKDGAALPDSSRQQLGINRAAALHASKFGMLV